MNPEPIAGAPRTMRTQAVVLLLVALAAGCLTACGPRHVTRFPDPVSASAIEHCPAESIGAFVPLSAEDQSVLDDETRRRDERTIDLMLERAGREIAARSDSVDACVRTLEEGEASFNRLLAQNRDRLASAGDFVSADDEQILAVQKRITDLWRHDQSARATIISLPLSESRGAAFWANRLATAQTLRADAASTSYLEELLEVYDWIDRERFGASVSAHAWILVQHADDRVDLQAEVLSRMEPYLETGGIRPANYAYLWDRVAVNRGRPQRYGTQPIWTCTDRGLELEPIEDRQRADALRQELGMNSVADQLAEMSRNVCGTDAR